MRIVYLCADRGIPVRGHKGAAVHVRALLQGLAQAGHAVTLLTVREGPLDGPVVPAKVIAVPLPAEAAALDAEGQARAHVEALYRVAAAHLAAHPADFIYERLALWSDAGARLAEATGLPLVVEVNAPLVEEAARFRALGEVEAARAIQARQLQRASHLSVVSEEVGDYVVANGAAAARVHVLPNAVDPRYFHPAVRGGSVRGQWGLEGKFVIGFAGRVRPWHDLDTLLQAFIQLRQRGPQYHLLLVGEMPTDLPARLAGLGLSEAVTLTGPIPHAAMPEHLAAMDVAVSPHPALDNFYFSPLKLFEYLACGLPTVAAAVGQPARLIRSGETGYLYPPGDAQALAGLIEMLVAQPAHARQIAWQGATAVLERHTWEGNARAVVSWLAPQPLPAAPARLDPDLQVVWPEPVALPILDRKLRQRLYRATRGDLAGPLLAAQRPAEMPPTEWPAGKVEAIEVLKYKPARRCVLAYRLAGPTGPVTVIGKVFRDERGERLYQLQDYLWRHGFGPENRDDIHVARPLAYVPEMRMFVQAQAPGDTLNALAGAAELYPFVWRSAEALAKLHRLPIAADLPVNDYRLADELGHLQRFATDLHAMRPADARRVADLHHALVARARALPQPPALALLHRDFYYSQLLFAGPRVTLIDFDLMARGDPALDVANFSAHLYFLGLDRLGDFNALHGEAQAFQEAYAHWEPAGSDFNMRCAFYTAATFFRLLHVVAPRPGLAHLFEAVLRRTAACLELA